VRGDLCSNLPFDIRSSPLLDASGCRVTPASGALAPGVYFTLSRGRLVSRIVLVR